MEMATIVIFLHDEIPETICRTPALIALSGEPVVPSRFLLTAAYRWNTIGLISGKEAYRACPFLVDGGQPKDGLFCSRPVCPGLQKTAKENRYADIG